MPSCRHTSALITSIAILLCLAPEAASQNATVETRVVVHSTAQQPIPCRVHVANLQGQPQKAVDLPFWKDHFVCPGHARLNLQPGEYTWVAERGPEFSQASGQLTVRPNQPASVHATLSRITNLRTEGWYSGDLHVHRPVNDIQALMLAEDLDFAPVITWWNTPASRPEPVDPIRFRFDHHRVYEILAGEDEREGGALLFFGLKRPIALSVKSREYPSPMHFVREAKQRNESVWIDIEKPFWWDVPIWLASGQMNSIGIANNHMCRNEMYESEAWGKPRNETRLPAPRGNGFWTQEIYYHLLNCGLRIPPSAGSASGVLPNPVGYNRVYVHLDSAFTRKAWFEALAKGRCFVTNGPLLRVTAEGHPPGHTFTISDGKPLTIQLTIQLASRDDLSQLEIIHNGQVIRTLPCHSRRPDTQHVELKVDQPGWFLIRAITNLQHTFRFASTAPWFLETPTVKQRVSRRSAEFFQAWVDERIDRVKRNVPDAQQQREILEPHEAAREFWAERVRNANASR